MLFISSFLRKKKCIASIGFSYCSVEIIVEEVAAIAQNTLLVQPMPVSSVIIEEKTNYLRIALWSFYGLVTTVLSVRFILNLLKIQRRIQRNPTEKIQDSTLVLLDDKVLPHTFMNYIFINKKDYKNRKIEDELYTHELTHARQKHTLDILFIETLKTLFWFNPMFILYKKAIQLNHEFLADEKVVKSYNNVPFYQSLLLEKASRNSNFYLASNLNFLVTKKRLIMMTKTTSAKIMLLKKVVLLPLFTGLIYFLCIETVAQQKIETQNHEPNISDKTKDTYFAGVRIKVYKNGHTTKTAHKGEGLILNKLYEELTTEEKEKYAIWLSVPKALQKKSPSQKELNDYKDAKKFAIWIDGKNVPNAELNTYKPSEIAYFSGSSVLKNARTKKHPQPFQFWFYTHSYFDKNEMGKQKEKYGSDLIEIFENYKDTKGNKQTVITNSSSNANVSKKEANIVNEKQEAAVQELPKNDSDVYTSVEKKPEFPGGMQAFLEFVGKNYKMPEGKNINGKIFIHFIIEIDGSLTDIKAMRDIGNGTGEEGVRVLKMSPKWIPGEQDGKPVRVQYSLPITISS